MQALLEEMGDPTKIIVSLVLTPNELAVLTRSTSLFRHWQKLGRELTEAERLVMAIVEAAEADE